MAMRTRQQCEKREKPKHRKQSQLETQYINIGSCSNQINFNSNSNSNSNSIRISSDHSDLEHDLSLLPHPKRSVRIEAHSSLSTRLSSCPSHGFASANYVTLLFHCLHSINNGTQKRSKVSKPEFCLSLRLVSLLAINLLAGGEHAHQVFDECLPVLSRALLHFESSNSDSDTVMALLDCLSFVGFFGSTHPEEIQTVMLIIWDSFTNNYCNWSDLVRIKAISAWSFLLSSMPGSHVSNKYWKSVTSYFSNVIGDEGVGLAVADALGLIFEMGFFNKFEERVEDGCWRDKIKDKIVHKLSGLAIEEVDNDDDEDGYERTLETAQKVEDGILLSKVSQTIQRKFIREFLGLQGFAKYLQDNSNLQNMFKLRQRRRQEDDDRDLDEPEREEVTVKFYCPSSLRREHRFDDILPFMSGKEKQVHKRMIKSPSSLSSKARSQLLKKQREIRTGVISGSVFDY